MKKEEVKKEEIKQKQEIHENESNVNKEKDIFNKFKTQNVKSISSN